MLKKIILFICILLNFTGCELAGISSIEEKKLQEWRLTATYDYGMHIKDKATILLDYNRVFFNLKDYNIDKLVAGDEVIIKYSGDIYVQEMYPGNVVLTDAIIHSIEINKAEIIEFTLTEDKLVASDSKYDNYLVPEHRYVVNEDDSFQVYDELPIGSKVYGSSLSLYKNCICVDALYSFKPR